MTKVLESTRRLRSACEAIGVKLPRKVIDQLEAADAVVAGARVFRLPNGALVDAVVEAIEADRDPASDPEVQRIITAANLNTTSLVSGVEQRMSGRLQPVVEAHSDAIVTLLRALFDTAAESLVRLRDRIGERPLTDVEFILSQGGDIADVWAAAKTATGTTIPEIVKAWEHLAAATGRPPVAAPQRVLRITDPAGPLPWARDHANQRTRDAWEVCSAGLDLSLAGLDEIAQRAECLRPAPPVVPEAAAAAA